MLGKFKLALIFSVIPLVISSILVVNDNVQIQEIDEFRLFDGIEIKTNNVNIYNSGRYFAIPIKFGMRLFSSSTKMAVYDRDIDHVWDREYKIPKYAQSYVYSMIERPVFKNYSSCAYPKWDGFIGFVKLMKSETVHKEYFRKTINEYAACIEKSDSNNYSDQEKLFHQYNSMMDKYVRDNNLIETYRNALNDNLPNQSLKGRM